MSARIVGKVRSRLLRGTRGVPLCLFSYRTKERRIKEWRALAVGFELRLDVNASVSPYSVLSYRIGDTNQNGAPKLEVFELPLDPDTTAGHLFMPPFIEPIKPIRMAHEGIQVEAELEPYRLGAPSFYASFFLWFDRRRGKAGRFAYHGEAKAELESYRQLPCLIFTNRAK